MKRFFTFFFCVLLFSANGTEPFDWQLISGTDSATVKVTVAPNHYFYADSLNITVKGTDNRPLLPAESAVSTLFNDEFAGESAIYPSGEYQWKFNGLPPFEAEISFQGCTKGDAGNPAMCLMPQTVKLSGSFPAERLTGELEDTILPLDDFKTLSVHSGMMTKAEFLQFLSGSKNTPSAELPASGGLIALLFLTLTGGILLNFTPCILPMIPINLAIIGAKNSGRKTGFLRGLCYGAGIAATYGILGVAVILSGAKFGELNSQSWFNFLIAALFAVLACGMFGWLNLDFSRFSPGVRQAVSGSREVVAFALGGISALLAGACVAPVVIGTLLVAARFYQEGHSVALGLPFLLGAGMGLPWPFAGAGMAILPKPGKFMVWIKYFFGVIILAAGAYYLWLGVTLLPGKYSPEAELLRLEEAMTRAAAKGSPLLIDFWATWCKNCSAMERKVLNDPEIRQELKKFEVVRFQAEKPGDPAISFLLERWQLSGLPAFVILQKKSQ